MQLNERPYQEVMIKSDLLEIPRNTYQRELNPDRVRRIALHFDERVANEPKVSLRNGHYYVFDGQHTIAARVERNKRNPLPILCKVYKGMTESEEAMLFADQFGDSADLGAGIRLRALIFAGEPEACAFMKATESEGICIDYNQQRGKKRIGCVATALNEFRRIGTDKYREALKLLVESWDGHPDAMRAETISGVCRFVELYFGEYDRKRLIKKFRGVDPLMIYRKGNALGTNLPGYKKYLYQVLAIYNGSSSKTALPMKF